MNTCVCCGAPIPEGRQVCPKCENGFAPDAILEDGTPLYFKTTSSKFGGKIPGGANFQNELYAMLCGYKRAVDKED